MTCQVYLDRKNNEFSEDLTPQELRARAVEVSEMSIHNRSMTEFKTRRKFWQSSILSFISLTSFTGQNKTFGNLHQSKLVFQPGNSFRPKARYL